MIRPDERMLVMAEDDAAGVDWYQHGFEPTQEAPFKSLSPKEFSCKLNRGAGGARAFSIEMRMGSATSASSSGWPVLE